MKKLRDGEVFTAGSMIGSSVKSGVQGAVAGWKRGGENGKFGRKMMGAMGSAFAGAGFQKRSTAIMASVAIIISTSVRLLFLFLRSFILIIFYL